MFTAGQGVFSSNHGKGVVTRIDEEALLYPVQVTFCDGSVEEFTQSGKEFISEDQPSLKFRENMMDEFYKGQKVHCKSNGNGVVTARGNAYEDYPIKARFANGYCETYTQDGKVLKDARETHLTSRGEEVMPTDFYVGQKVWCVLFGEGVVAEITHGLYPVNVRFENGEVESYTSKGHLLHRGNRTLFHRPVKIVQGESATKPSIDWSHVKGEYKWLAVDKDGSAYVYENEPEHSGSDHWLIHNGSLNEVSGLASYTPGTCDWEHSLVKRPD